LSEMMHSEGRAERRDRISLRGLAIDPLTEAEAISSIFSALDRGRGGTVLTPNLDHLRRYVRDPSVRAAYGEAELVLADGFPLVWASRLQRTPLPCRVAGSDLIWTVSASAAQRDRSIFLLGGAPGVARAAGTRLQQRFPGLQVAGDYYPAPGFIADPDQMTAISELVASSTPDLVLVGLPSPMAENVISRLRQALPSAWFLGLGVSLSFVSGDVKRAPRAIQRSGLEWLWRIYQEPRRLARRYLLDGVPFAIQLLVGAAAARYR